MTTQSIPVQEEKPGKNITQHVSLFVIITFVLAITGGIIAATVTDAGLLLFIGGPLIAVIGLRTLGGDGWSDAGLSLNLKQSWTWYIFALLAYPITMSIAVIAGLLSGATTLNTSAGEILPLIAAGMAVQLLPRMIFAICEEWGWRGYLEPKLAAMGIPDIRRHLTVGIIWGLWHIPLIVFTDYTNVPFTIFIPMFIIGITIDAIVYGQMLLESKTVWTAVVLHGIANTYAFALLESGVFTFNDELFAHIAPPAVIMILMWSLLAVWIVRYRRGKIVS